MGVLRHGRRKAMVFLRDNIILDVGGAKFCDQAGPWLEC